MLRHALLLGFVLLSTASAAEPVRVGGEGARQPRLAVGAGGAVYLAYGAGEDIFCARSDDGGKTFGEAVKIGSLPKLALAKRRGPRVAATGDDVVVVTAISHGDGNLVSWRSADRGETWEGPVRVNDVPKACREGLHDTAAGANGEVASLWLDLRNDKMELWMSVSRDGGATWEANRQVYRSPGGSICECCHPTLAAGADGWRFLWRNSVGGNRDIYVSALADGSESPEKALRLGKANWELAACPMDGGDFALGKNGAAWAVWRRDETCYATDVSKPEAERLLGPGEQPVVAVTDAGPVFAWLAGRPGDLLVLKPGEKKATIAAKNASDPDLVVGPKGELLLAWERIEGEKTAVFVTGVGAGRARGGR